MWSPIQSLVGLEGEFGQLIVGRLLALQRSCIRRSLQIGEEWRSAMRRHPGYVSSQSYGSN